MAEALYKHTEETTVKSTEIKNLEEYTREIHLVFLCLYGTEPFIHYVISNRRWPHNKAKKRKSQNQQFAIQGDSKSVYQTLWGY
jgi:hypothetical protein